MLHKTLKSYHDNSPWDRDEHPDGPLWLITPDELEELPNGIELESISGQLVSKGRDYIDEDTRSGYLAYGIRGWRNGK